MKNLKEYDFFGSVEESSDHLSEGSSCMSPSAMEAIKSACKSCLMEEAHGYDQDENPDHTYEGYVNKCMEYLKECMGQAGYASLANPYKG